VINSSCIEQSLIVVGIMKVPEWGVGISSEGYSGVTTVSPPPPPDSVEIHLNHAASSASSSSIQQRRMATAVMVKSTILLEATPEEKAWR
jgi:hypothetical protein